jgi:hypothetical protein
MRGLALRAAQQSLGKTLGCHPYYNLIEKILQCQGARVGSASRDASVFKFLNGDDSWLANSFLLSL